MQEALEVGGRSPSTGDRAKVAKSSSGIVSYGMTIATASRTPPDVEMHTVTRIVPAVRWRGFLE